MKRGHLAQQWAQRVAALCALAVSAAATAAVIVPDALLQTSNTGVSVNVIVEIDTRAVDALAAQRRATLPRQIDDAAALLARINGYRNRKAQVLGALARPDIETLIDYSHLPLVYQRVRSAAALRALAALPGVRALHPDRLYQRVLAESLPLVSQPAVTAAGFGGAGATVAVIDDGIDLAQVGCTTVATPAGCRVSAVQTFVANPSTSNAHGTNVAAIVLGTAPAAKVAVLDVFTDAGALSSDIVNAINWAIANRSALNIVALNMSLGDNSRNPSPCSNSLTNPFASPIASARAAGLHVAVAAGNAAYNNGSFAAGLANPACTPGAVSVGAVYDANVGGLVWSNGTSAQCTDNATAADQIACFSMSASYLSLLAPGALITAGGSTQGGTSQATPHVAGALAVLRSAFPTETLAAIEARLTANGTPITDARNGVTKPRLNLRAAARPVNDDFASAIALAGNSGSAPGDNRLATHEAGEPQPSPGSTQSVWWRWTAPANGQVSLDTLGSSFDTRLDVYTGTSVGALTPVAGNDNADGATVSSALRFQAVAGTTYRWAVDSSDANAGGTSLQWSLNTSAKADLSVSLSGPTQGLPGSTVSYTLVVSNAGPQSATNVLASVALPAGLSVVSVPAGCATQAAKIDCLVAELTNGASATFVLSLRIDSLQSPVALNASVSSDLPDAAVPNNTASVALALGGDGDVPTLPAWLAMWFGAWLLWQLQQASAGRPGSLGASLFWRRE